MLKKIICDFQGKKVFMIIKGIMLIILFFLLFNKLENEVFLYLKGTIFFLFLIIGIFVFIHGIKELKKRKGYE